MRYMQLNLRMLPILAMIGFLISRDQGAWCAKPEQGTGRSGDAEPYKVNSEMQYSSLFHTLITGDDNWILSWRKSRDPQDQFIRLLLWAALNDPIPRREVFTQWLSTLRLLPSIDYLIRALKPLVSVRSPEEIEVRNREIVDIYPKVKQQREAGGRLGKIAASFAPNLIMDQLKDMSELLGTASFFQQDAQGRRRIYDALPDLRRFEGGDQETGNIYLLLWVIEPDSTLRNECLYPRFKRGGSHYFDIGFVPDLWVKTLAPLIVNMNDEQKRQREAEIQAMEVPRFSPEQVAQLAEEIKKGEARVIEALKKPMGKGGNDYTRQLRRRKAAYYYLRLTPPGLP